MKAIERFSAEGQDYKVELIEDLVRNEGVDTVTLYRNGPFTDLCRGPHGPSTGRVKAFKLTAVAGAYWRGDASRQMLKVESKWAATRVPRCAACGQVRTTASADSAATAAADSRARDARGGEPATCNRGSLGDVAPRCVRVRTP